MAETVPVLTQTSPKSAFFGHFLDGFSGFRHLVAVLQHFFSSLLAVGHRMALGFGTGMMHDVDRQETRCLRCRLRRAWRKPCIMHSFVDQIRVQPIASRDLRSRYIRRYRLNADRPLLVIRPKPPHSTHHPQPHSVHYPERTLSHWFHYRQGSQAGRLPHTAHGGKVHHVLEHCRVIEGTSE